MGQEFCMMSDDTPGKPVQPKMSALPSNIVRRGVTFVVSFGLGKGTSFLAALAMPRLMDARIYGGIELALTIGTLGAAVAGLGATSVAIRRYLVDKEPRAETMVFVHCLWLAVVALAAAGGLAAAGWAVQYVCGAAMIGIIGFQASASSFTRLRGRVHLSGWFDNISMIIVLTLAAFVLLAGKANLVAFTWCVAAAVASSGIAAAIMLIRKPVDSWRQVISDIVRLGTPMMLFGGAMMLIFGTIRIAIARELALADVACFSLCARICLVLIFVSQALATGLFRPIYQAGGETIARGFRLWIVALSAIAFVVAIIGRYGAPVLVAGTTTPPADFAAVFPAVVVQTSIWVLNSNLEIFVLRELISRQAAVACVVIAALGLAIGAAVVALGLLNLMCVINLYSALMATLLLTQMKLLSRKGIDLRRTYWALPLIGAPGLLYLLPRLA
jgi:hypothetical protein